MSKFDSLSKTCRKIVAVGRNYKDHALELKNSVPDKPLLFMKPGSAIIQEPSKIQIPDGCKQLNHEIELGLVVGKDLQRDQSMSVDVMEHIAGFVLALDMTARDFQDDAKKVSHPWTLAKCFDTSCPISKFVPLEEVTTNLSTENSLFEDTHVQVALSLNSADNVQCGNTSQMLFNPKYLVQYIINYFRLEVGDIILTGTPSGVGRVNSGDCLRGEMSLLKTRGSPGENCSKLVEMEFSVQ